MRLRRKKWAPETIARHPGTALNLDSLNNLPEFSYLEIGSGKGRFLLTMAKNNPSRKYLGIEMNYNAYSLAIKLSEDPLFAEFDNGNYAFINAPCERVFEKIKPESLDCIYLNFSDPQYWSNRSIDNGCFPFNFDWISWCRLVLVFIGWNVGRSCSWIYKWILKSKVQCQ